MTNLIDDSDNSNKGINSSTYSNAEYASMIPSKPSHLYKKKSLVRKQATLSYDGKQFLIRIPNAISQLCDFKKGDKIEFIVEADSAKNVEKFSIKLKVIDDARN